MEHIISFPGIGIGEFTVKSVAFEIFGRQIAWYGIIITCAIILAVLLIYYHLRKQGLILDDLIDVTFCTVLPGIVGARLYYVFFDWLEHPAHYQTFTDVIAIWNGGLAIYGGIIFGALGCILALRWKKIHIPAFFDILGPSVQLAQAIGRWGNFMNGEAYGGETNLPWRMQLDGIAVHPTFLYESLWNLLGFGLAMAYTKKKKFDGEVCLLYLAWYGLGRTFIEGLRTDSLHLGSSGIRVSQLLAALIFIVALGGLIFLRFIKKYRYRSECIYLSESKQYDAAMEYITASANKAAASKTDEKDEKDEKGEKGEKGDDPAPTDSTNTSDTESKNQEDN